MKRCPKCKQEKPLSEFYKNRAQKDGKQPYCKVCINIAQNDRYANEIGFREAKNEATRKWRLKMKNILGEEELRRFRREENLKLHHLTPTQFAQIVFDQAGKCAICQEEFMDRQPHIDHDHKCCEGRHSCGTCIRGLLCASCNHGLGVFKDNIDIISAASVYLLQN